MAQLQGHTPHGPREINKSFSGGFRGAVFSKRAPLAAGGKIKKYRLLLSMLAVVVPGLVISGFGIVSISQQQKTRELKTAEKYTEALKQIRAEVEQEIEKAVQKTFRHFEESPVQLNEPGLNSNNLQLVLKEILLGNPIVKYPFLIDSKGRYIFPFSKKSTLPVAVPLFPGPADKKIAALHSEGERLEFAERKITEALKRYLRCLEYHGAGAQQLKPYLFNSIGRCYFKLRKYPQAVSYYQSIIDAYSQSRPPGKDLSLYFPVLRQAALSYQRLRWREDAVKIYLQLYEGILQYESSTNSDKFTFFKNEALDYLARHIPEGAAERGRFDRARSMDRLRESTELDISLRWRYYEYQYGAGDDAGEPGEKTRDASGFKFKKIREFYLANDEKTQFYKAIRGLDQWKYPPPEAVKTKTLRYALSNKPIDIAFRVTKKTPGGHAEAGDIFFGFMISPGFLGSGGVMEIIKKHLDDPGLRVYNNILPPDPAAPGDGPYMFKLLSLPFNAFFPGGLLELYSREKNYFQRRVQKEIRLNYTLMAAFILVLILGVYLFYKYLSRETELVRLKSDFTDSASHTLKTPLTRIRMLVEKLHLGWVTGEAKKKAYFQTILAETDRMGEMIDNMLDFSKIEAGRKQYRFEKTSLPEAVREAVESYTGYIRNLGFQLQVEIDDSIPPFPLDAEAVKLMVVNLLQNAVKYSGKEKFIAVRLYPDRENNGAVLEVEDKGIGMEEKDLKKIFERFYRAAGNPVQAVEGSGLGLYLVQHAVQAHNGKINVSSRPGKGSRFTVLMPLIKK